MTRFSSQALDELLGTGISQLDITPPERRLAVARYTAVARSLAEHWDTDPYDGLVYPQGSMRLGTITRNYPPGRRDRHRPGRAARPAEAVDQPGRAQDGHRPWPGEVRARRTRGNPVSR